MRMEETKALTVRTNTHAQQPVDWVDTVERTASVMKKFLTRTTCRLCQVYADEQVQYEVQLEKQTGMQHETSNWVASSVRNLEVELYRQFLFDENSVIQHADSFRDETEETEAAHDEEEIENGRTQAASSINGEEEEETMHVQHVNEEVARLIELV
ncbi:hypothetical protein MPSEU_000938900 [Mayamaea pseudoterrestris]|nr:hypothetical protein MPSEU_000938900 [Mayamaea pseudoterrestris]